MAGNSRVKPKRGSDQGLRIRAIVRFVRKLGLTRTWRSPLRSVGGLLVAEPLPAFQTDQRIRPELAIQADFREKHSSVPGLLESEFGVRVEFKNLAAGDYVGLRDGLRDVL